MRVWKRAPEPLSLPCWALGPQGAPQQGLPGGNRLRRNCRWTARRGGHPRDCQASHLESGWRGGPWPGHGPRVHAGSLLSCPSSSALSFPVTSLHFRPPTLAALGPSKFGTQKPSNTTESRERGSYHRWVSEFLTKNQSVNKLSRRIKDR